MRFPALMVIVADVDRALIHPGRFETELVTPADHDRFDQPDICRFCPQKRRTRLTAWPILLAEVLVAACGSTDDSVRAGAFNAGPHACRRLVQETAAAHWTRRSRGHHPSNVP